MGVFVALAVGYVVGARTGSKDLDQVGKALKALSASEEFADVVSAVRSHLGHTLRELAGDDRGRPPGDRDGRPGRAGPAPVPERPEPAPRSRLQAGAGQLGTGPSMSATRLSVTS